MTQASDPVVAIERHGAVALITLNRPEAINAINNQIRAELPAALQELDEDPSVRCLVLTGAGERGFCAGADIKEGRTAGSPAEELRRMTPAAWIEALDRVAKPIIAAIHGICLGGGLELALACDVRMAARGARFGLPETALGLIPGGGGTQRLPRLIGLGRALDLLLSAEAIDADEAYRIGLVTRISASPEAVLADALHLANAIASRPPIAVVYVKEAARAGLDAPFSAGLKLEKGLFALLTSTADHAEAVAAFKEKRQPHFQGR
jgi:enoyl-CoA hydratase/carnithine racemase